MNDYQAFLASKAPRPVAVGIEPASLPDHIFDFQSHCIDFELRQGRAGCFRDTGLGKTIDELEFGRQAEIATNKPSLLFAPLAVTKQIMREGQRFGYECQVIRDQSQVRSGLNIINYDRREKIDPEAFGAVILDEGSILKSFTGATTRALIQMFANTRFKLSATATPAPNDHMELGQQAEFLGIMASNEMLARWFISDQTQMGRYRLKRYGEESFWDWMASWSRMAATPEDLGFDGSRFVLPPLNVIKHRTHGEVRPAKDGLFAADISATNMFDVKRQTTRARADATAEIVLGDREQWVVWCDTNIEADALKARFGEDAVEVRGSQSIEEKEEKIDAFTLGQARVIITKSSITGYGCNWQHCHKTVFVGRTFSYEDWYQAIRRMWRFGQTMPVDAHLIVAEGEDQIGRVVDRKAGEHAAMKQSMANAMRRDRGRASQVKVPYDPQHVGRMPAWLTSLN
jgi:hypothetical protein